MKRVILVGSPRSNGRSAHLAEMLFEANIDERPEDELFLVPVSEIEVGPCIGCNACRAKSEVIFKDADGNEVSEQRHRCVFDDDMQTLYDLLDEADMLTIVCPVYFSGAPAPMKCVLDRLQPYFWEYCENGPKLPKRPLQLHIIGEGGDPHGFVPLISEVKGTTALAGFGLEQILSWVGKMGDKGEILAEAEEVPVPPKGSYAVFAAPGEDEVKVEVSSGGATASEDSDAKAAHAKERGQRERGHEKGGSRSGAGSVGAGRAKQATKPRPKLDLSQGGKGKPNQSKQAKGRNKGGRRG